MKTDGDEVQMRRNFFYIRADKAGGQLPGHGSHLLSPNYPLPPSVSWLAV